MLALEIAPNSNCQAVELRVFHDLEPPRPVTHVRLEPPDGGPARWYAVTGWTPDGRPCPALARRVEDSGDGVALLVSGGEAGLRFQPADTPFPWSPQAPFQHGAPFLLIGEVIDLRFAGADASRPL